MGALRQRRERDNISVTANTTTPILGRRRSSGSTISKLVLRIGTLVMIVAVPMLYNMTTPDLQTSSAQKQKNDVTVKKDTNDDAASEFESPKRKEGEAKTNQEAADAEPSIAWEIMPAADHMDATIQNSSRPHFVHVPNVDRLHCGESFLQLSKENHSSP